MALKLSEDILKFYKEVKSFDIFVLYNMLTQLILVTTCHCAKVLNHYIEHPKLISVLLYTNYTYIVKKLKC